MKIINNLVRDKGFAVLPIQNMKKFNQLRDKFIKKMKFNHDLRNINNVRKKIALMNKSEINKLMVNLLSFNDASELMIESCRNIVKELSGEKIFVQRRAATIFNLPGFDQRRQWPHYELMSGISPYTFILWAPFHDLEDDGGVFYVEQKKSLNLIKIEHSKGLVNGPTILSKKIDQKPPKLKYGEVIVFNPFILHGNIGFKSKLARIACSTRFQSTNVSLMQKNSDFFKYYKLN